MDDFAASIDLVRRAKAGDTEALDGLFSRYYSRVHKIARLRLGPRLREKVESVDVVQETFAAAVGAFERFDVRDESSLINWLAKIVERQVLSLASFHSAQKRKEMNPVLPLDPQCGIDPEANGLTPSEDLSKAEQTAWIETCIARLPQKYRELIILRDYAGCSWSGIARELGKGSDDAARKMHKDALRALQKLVNEPK